MELEFVSLEGIDVYVVGSLDRLIVSVRYVGICVIEQPSVQ